MSVSIRDVTLDLVARLRKRQQYNHRHTKRM
jgi:hypothetical protein